MFNKIEKTTDASADVCLKTDCDGARSNEASNFHHMGSRKKLTIDELEQLATKNNPTFSKERNSYGGFTTKSFNTLKINH